MGPGFYIQSGRRSIYFHMINFFTPQLHFVGVCHKSWFVDVITWTVMHDWVKISNIDCGH